ncbi:hypothetical protein [Cellulomonas sp. Leaf334]|uniref:hypothetical protein n=1 Tax=Cellulomonas sp. Leaf334 TaxID=1736339 RepID=UPI0006F3009F|nr:hypothetical protein [Cellulomonas sp. Leaf334]KQR08578.1 hypothetical protein ASF78_20265 [Cellulomonas sp. Leaf334]
MSAFTDTNADHVHTFALQMGNLGLSRVTDLLLAMFESGAWREFTDGTGAHRFLPGEYDYFLTQQGVTRDHVMHGVRDVEVKARLEEAMDERRTGEDGYRRRLEDVRRAVPERPGNPIEPFGCSRSEGTLVGVGARPALGRAPRTYRLTGGATTKRPNERLDRTQRMSALIRRLSDLELEQLVTDIAAEQALRSRTRAEADAAPAHIAAN